jgi:hypothetical protein
MRIAFLSVLLLLWAAGCADPGKPPSTDTQAKSEGAVINDTVGSVPPRPFDRELAETLAAMYFSDLNRAAKYPRYKGLLIAIDTPLPNGLNGAAAFGARINGRIWETPNGDTATLPYRDTLAFMAAWDGQKWTARVNE